MPESLQAPLPQAESAASPAASPESGALSLDTPWFFQYRSRLIIALAALIVIASWWGRPATWPLAAAGLALVAFSFFLRLWSIRQIGGAARRRVQPKASQLINWGPFGLVRNPIYLANMAFFAGFTVFAGLPWLVPAVVGILFLQYTFTVRFEEKFLREKFGPAFDEYAKSTPRWLPALRWVPPPDGFTPYPVLKMLKRERSFLIQLLACVGFAVARALL
ncbi:MAG: isoprenylcysteine carboxylmethyltransferase family protein [Planctomycetes bacterium]|nr:isoprenylcysteine carboxylmethyltransferase family protein [Planctomycetota bacterium]